jgi:hypothetical protein
VNSNGVLLFVTAAGVAAVAVACSQPGGNPRGHGDGPGREGLSFDAQLQLGQLQPPDHTRWHYGGGQPGQALPGTWQRHRLGYPRRQAPATEECQVTPMSDPAFPKNEAHWFYRPPAEVNI